MSIFILHFSTSLNDFLQHIILKVKILQLFIYHSIKSFRSIDMFITLVLYSSLFFYQLNIFCLYFFIHMLKYARLIILKIKYVLPVMTCTTSCRSMTKWERDMHTHTQTQRERKKERERELINFLPWWWYLDKSFSAFDATFPYLEDTQILCMVLSLTTWELAKTEKKICNYKQTVYCISITFC